MGYRKQYDGAYVEYTGNGLTMSLHKNNGKLTESNEFGMKEAFTFETKPMMIKEMMDSDKGILDYVILKSWKIHQET